MFLLPYISLCFNVFETQSIFSLLYSDEALIYFSIARLMKLNKAVPRNSLKIPCLNKCNADLSSFDFFNPLKRSLCRCIYFVTSNETEMRFVDNPWSKTLESFKKQYNFLIKILNGSYNIPYLLESFKRNFRMVCSSLSTYVSRV